MKLQWGDENGSQSNVAWCQKGLGNKGMRWAPRGGFSNPNKGCGRYSDATAPSCPMSSCRTLAEKNLRERRGLTAWSEKKGDNRRHTYILAGRVVGGREQFPE
jgi:hypothetical protein